MITSILDFVDNSESLNPLQLKYYTYQWIRFRKRNPVSKRWRIDGNSLNSPLTILMILIKDELDEALNIKHFFQIINMRLQKNKIQFYAETNLPRAVFLQHHYLARLMMLLSISEVLKHQFSAWKPCIADIIGFRKKLWSSQGYSLQESPLKSG